MNWVIPFNLRLAKLLAQLATVLGFGCVAIEAWATFTDHNGLVGPFAALALVLLLLSLFIKRLVS
jgi:hypothetical protein